MNEAEKKSKILIGIGNELNGDDSVGCFIADNFSQRGWLSVNAGPVPGNFSGLINRERPELLLVVDAAEMKLEPGEIRRLKPEQADSVFYSTHSLPVSEFLARVKDSVKEIVLIGIQPKSMEQFDELDGSVKQAALDLIKKIKKEKLKEIEFL